MLRVGEVAKRLDVSVSTVYSLVAAGRLRACRVGVGRGAVRVSEEQLSEFLKASETATLPVSTRKAAFKHVVIPRS